MKTYLLDTNEEIARAWRGAFANTDAIVINRSLADFLCGDDVECVVSPANGFGLMDGGYDQAITDWYGPELQKLVQRRIISEWYGEQPVGTSLFIETDSWPPYLIHTPTMRYPKPIIDIETIYHCTRSALICAMQHKADSVVLPAFGAGCGLVPPAYCARMMAKAYQQILTPPKSISWDYVFAIS